MRCVNTKPVGTDPKTGKQLVEAMIIADTEPETLPTSKAGPGLKFDCNDTPWRRTFVSP